MKVVILNLSPLAFHYCVGKSYFCRAPESHYTKVCRKKNMTLRKIPTLLSGPTLGLVHLYPGRGGSLHTSEGAPGSSPLHPAP